LRVAAHIGFDDDALAMQRRVQWKDDPCGRAFFLNDRVTVEDACDDTSRSDIAALAGHVGFRAIHSTPLVTRTGVSIGALSVYSLEAGTPSDTHRAFLDLCAQHAADVVDTSRRQQRLVDADRRKDVFIAQLAHEMRNPLAPIVNAARLMSMTTDATVIARSRA